jgi:predicted ABC-type transport system involved in lysophospholipase L1 biosynthesis ATPase subunit
VLILDEPTANVDNGTEQKMESLLYSLTAESEMGVLATTHSGSWAKRARRINIEENRVI